MIRIVLADDHPIVREGLAAVLATQPDFLVVGEASDGAELVRQAQVLQPDVVLTDLEMPGVDGVAAIAQLHAAASSARVVVLTAFDNDDRIVSALQAGASGYLLKGAPRHEIFNAIRVVAGGGSLLSPIVASRMLEHLRGDAGEALTERERDVLQRVALGHPNKQIAADLNLSLRTVKFHVSNVLAKLAASNRTEAVRLARQRGWLDPQT